MTQILNILAALDRLCADCTSPLRTATRSKRCDSCREEQRRLKARERAKRTRSIHSPSAAVPCQLIAPEPHRIIDENGRETTTAALRVRLLFH